MAQAARKPEKREVGDWYVQTLGTEVLRIQAEAS